MTSEGQKGVKNVFLWAVNNIMLYLGPNEVTGLKKSKQFLLVVRSLCMVLTSQQMDLLSRASSSRMPLASRCQSVKRFWTYFR